MNTYNLANAGINYKMDKVLAEDILSFNDNFSETNLSGYILEIPYYVCTTKDGGS